MQYKKIRSGDTIIEFHNNWLGEETVIINGQIVSKKSSVWGTHHHFSVFESGHQVRYVLTTKVGANLQVFLDLRRNGELIKEDVIVPYGTMSQPKNNAKKNGVVKLKDYELEEALKDFEKALDIEPNDPEIYFHMACAYSVLEDRKSGFECLRNAVKHKLKDIDMIFKHDMLAYIRMSKAFENFVNSNFTEYDLSQEIE
jgi:tetratricopeptide (TPR) repeat protein